MPCKCGENSSLVCDITPSAREPPERKAEPVTEDMHGRMDPKETKYTNQLVDISARHDKSLNRNIAMHEQVEQQCSLVFFQRGAQDIVESIVIRLEGGHSL